MLRSPLIALTLLVLPGPAAADDGCGEIRMVARA